MPYTHTINTPDRARHERVAVPTGFRRIVTGAVAVLVAASLAFPLSAGADPVQPMSHDAAYELTCGHLGVPCVERKKSACGRNARSARRKVSVRAKRARCARHR